MSSETDDRNRILETASRRFMETGISKVTLDEIAAELGMSKKTLYKHFPSKDHLLRDMIRDRIQRNGKRLNEIMTSAKPFEGKLQEILAFVGKEVSAPGKQFIIDLRRLSPALWAEADEYRRTTIVTNLTGMIGEAKEEGVIRRDLDVTLFVLVFLSAVQNIMNPQTLAEQPFSASQAFGGILSILFEGALTDESRARAVFSVQPPKALSTEG